ncbi:hypothetical protein ACSJMR_00735 [Acinetobacter pecorum]|uniref:hypothetical protein n=1 Tax=Acinetobacter pecorum TaxID=2762215 RepID=UPI003EE4CD98
MQSILSLVSENPVLFTALFTLTNILWLIFSFYQKHKNNKALIDHKAEKDKELENIKHNFELELEKKKKNFGIKQQVYGDFFSNLDKFQSKANIDTQKMMNQYMQNYLVEFIKASELNDADAIANVTNQYQINIQSLFVHLSEELNTLNNECNRLKFVAPIEIRAKLKEITAGYDQIFKLTLSYVNNISNLFFEESAQNEMTKKFTADIQPFSEKLKIDMEAIENLLRSDLFS